MTVCYCLTLNYACTKRMTSLSIRQCVKCTRLSSNHLQVFWGWKYFARRPREADMDNHFMKRTGSCAPPFNVLSMQRKKTSRLRTNSFRTHHVLWSIDLFSLPRLRLKDRCIVHFVSRPFDISGISVFRFCNHSVTFPIFIHDFCALRNI